MIEKTLSTIAAGDVAAFLNRRVPESRTLDYKEELGNLTQRDPKKELVADVTALANASGGDLIVGVAEERDPSGAKTGFPGAANGIAIGTGADDFKRQLSSIVHDNTDPKLTSFDVHLVPGFPNGNVLLVRVKRSPAAPHMSRLDGRFYRRISSERPALDARGIREAFVESTDLEAAIRRFVHERTTLINTRRLVAVPDLDDPLPVKLSVAPDEAVLVVHVVPSSFMDRSQRIDVSSFDPRTALPDQGRSVWTWRYNLDGVVSWPQYGGSDPSRNESSWYWQVYRSGAIEYVDAYQPNTLRERDGTLSGDGIEAIVTETVSAAMGIVTASGAALPAFAFAALLNVGGRQIRREPNDYGRGPTVRIDRRNIVLPDVAIYDATGDIKGQLRPMFDALWQAGGWKRAPG